MTGVRIEGGDPFGGGRIATYLVLLTGLRGEKRTLVVSAKEDGWVSVQTQVDAGGVTADLHVTERKGGGLLVRVTLQGVRPEDFRLYSGRASVSSDDNVGGIVRLRDDGASPDRAARDGVFSGVLPLSPGVVRHVVLIQIHGLRDRYFQEARGS